MFERAIQRAKEISDGTLPYAYSGERMLAHAVLGLQARVEQLEEKAYPLLTVPGASFCALPERPQPDASLHYPGCWRAEGHHICAVELGERLLKSAGKCVDKSGTSE